MIYIFIIYNKIAIKLEKLKLHISKYENSLRWKKWENVVVLDFMASVLLD